MTRISVISELPELRATVRGFREKGERIALVPTMGALHEGHLSLVRLARRAAERVIVSIFVNPTQFGPNEDFATYPRQFEADIAALAQSEAGLVWAPPAEVMYPHGFATWIVPGGPAVAGLEDSHRPTFFRGVATVVTKLLLQCLPDAAVFGEKDYQQLKVVERLVNDLAIPVEIIAAPTIREPDGLAMSSRNAYLTRADREVAPKLYATLMQAADRIRSGAAIETVLAQGRESLTQTGFAVDYFEARDAETLDRVSERRSAGIRLLAAAKLGSTRLIDNIAV